MMMDILLFFKKRNFTVLREFEFSEGVFVKEYVYNSRHFLTDVWPPRLASGTTTLLPIRSAVRDDGTDVTETMILFSGPKRNYINHLGAYTKKRRLMVKFVNFGIRITLQDYWEPYEGNVTVTDVLGIKKVVSVSRNSSDGASCLPS